ncbi:simple sugar transport system ATP-binding protein [Proteiniborus sp. DW1]|uniref:ATP-binding cassette domain-containing protein n=1 Tax=Proteiniborus sp. DW1 TaxID=1889883 RepID=UPI00092DF978|nr:ATP-binding cassette domain-containing protein [Proteiniborus sp. DW1]SCG82874.1 simple sugar transport system ATP-binding protein [Proteiniborus sp. DW1]
MNKESEIQIKPFVKVKNITKRFGSIEALKAVNLECYLGEVLAVVGDNGAGKTTLIKILSGASIPDSGEIWIDDERQKEMSPKTSLDKGISTVYQDLSLVDTCDVSYNIFLGREPLKGCFIDKKKMDEESKKLIQNLGIQISSINEPVGRMSGGQRQGVAVARAVHQGGKLLIFDEPTAAMGLVESTKVLKLIKKLAEDGYGIIIISHNLQQVFQIAHRICIMRQGTIVDIVKTDEVKIEDVISMITGAIQV